MIETILPLLSENAPNAGLLIFAILFYKRLGVMADHIQDNSSRITKLIEQLAHPKVSLPLTGANVVEILDTDNDRDLE